MSICCVQDDKMFLGKLHAKCDSGTRYYVEETFTQKQKHL